MLALGDVGLLLRWPAAPDPDSVARVQHFARALAQRTPSWVQDWVPAYCSLAVILRDDAEITLATARHWLQRALSDIEDSAGDAVDSHAGDRPMSIPVCYDPEFGTDLDALAKHANISVDELVERHTAPLYHVAMLGFSPGFPYLLGLDPSLAMPRRSTPRPSIAAGSVAIAGAQAGIYPNESPGGWQVLGRTPLTLFDAAREPPSLLRAGDALRFVPITRAQFDNAFESSIEGIRQ